LALSFSKRLSGTKAYYNLVRRVAFPKSTNVVFVTSFVSATLGLSISFSIAQRSAMSFVLGAYWGIMVLVVPAFVSDVALHMTIMKHDPLFYLRRCLAFSLFTITTWVIVFLMSSVLALVLPEFVFPNFAVVVGFFAIMPLRSIVVFSMSETSFARRLLFTLTEPALTGGSVVLVFGVPVGTVLVGLVLSSLAGLAFAFALIVFVEFDGRRTIGFSPIRMFRALLSNLLESRNEELESYLTELGEETRLGVTEIVFRRKPDHDIKAVLLVANFHPGPFKNIGSSALPYLFPSIIERRFGALGVVPHGVSGHELNLVSQEQNARVINWAITNLENAHSIGEATPVERSRNGIATATSQVFDGCALVTMTTAPHDMEDIPEDVAHRFTGLTHGRFRHVAVIDAHNCLGQETTLTSEKIVGLEEAAMASVESATKRGAAEFRVGVAHRDPGQFTLKDGFGPAGINVIGIKVGQQTFAYIIIDGNNMVRGLREDILASARRVGFEDAEVMTTDTHMVNGIVSAPLGYHTVGEVVSRDSLLTEVQAACQQAMTDLEPGEVGAVSGQIPVITLGTKSLRNVMALVYRIAKLTAVTLFPIVAALALLSLVFLV
jgi:putative membrane protein